MNQFISRTMLGSLCLVLTSLSTGYLSAQAVNESIVTEGGESADFLVRNIFAATTCENIFNIASVGNSAGIGYFENGSASLGLNRGIILSTGPISNAMGPNQATDQSGNFDDTSGDPDLNVLATNQVHDAVGITFSFVPLDSVVTFRYVFASEEYCEFVGSNYNDVFGFFVRGPGISGGFPGGGENVALIPGTNDYVAINSVNHNQNSNVFVRNELANDADACGLVPVDHPNKDRIEYDGFTQVLTATLHLIPCQTYDIRLVVGDVNDGFFDSAVFLEAGSFDLGGAVDITAQGPVNNDGAYEGCSDGFFRFTRQNQEMMAFPLPVHFTVIGGTSDGDDFIAPPSTVIIPAEQAYIDLPIESLNDDLDEPAEYLDIALNIPCACYADTARLYIYPPPPMEVLADDLYFICENAEQTITPEVAGGIAPFTYAWSNGTTQAGLTLNGNQVGAYTVTVTDACGHTAQDSLEVFSVGAPAAFLSGTASICRGDTAYLSVELTGQPPFSFTYSLDDGTTYTVTDVVDSMAFVPVWQGGVYTLLTVDDAACAGMVDGVGFIDETIIDAQAVVTEPDCAGTASGTIVLDPTGGEAPYTLQWADGWGGQPTLTQLPAATYTVTVTDAQDCAAVFDYTLTDAPPLSLALPDCDFIQNGDPVELTAAGGSPPYTYRVATNQNWQTAAIFATLLPGQSYVLSVQDDRGCVVDFPWLMPYFGGVYATLPPQATVDLGDALTLSPTLLLPDALLDSLRWTPAAQLDCADCLTPTVTTETGGEYQLTLVDVFGCTDVLTTRVIVDTNIDIYVPNAFSPNDDQQNDYLGVFGKATQLAGVRSMTVYDRWGGVVFQDSDLPINSQRHGWDGFIRGRKADAGVYVYVVEVELTDGTLRRVAGDVVLLR